MYYPAVKAVNLNYQSHKKSSPGWLLVSPVTTAGVITRAIALVSSAITTIESKAELASIVGPSTAELVIQVDIETGACTPAEALEPIKRIP